MGDPKFEEITSWVDKARQGLEAVDWLIKSPTQNYQWKFQNSDFPD
jgi:hypothetical protein